MTHMTLDLYSMPAKFEIGETVYKHGIGYSGPGRVFGVFLGEDKLFRYVIGHQIAGGQGWFYHIYDAKQFENYPDER